MKISKEKTWLMASGGLLGILGVALAFFGNPANMGMCVACFLRDIAGALKLHNAANVQYMRPEILGVVLGAFLISFFTKEFKPTAGSSPILRFVISFIVMIGALVFLGCPLRMILRLSAGDLNAFVGLVGFSCGIGVSCIFLSNGYTLGSSKPSTKADGLALPSVFLVLLLLALFVPSLFASSVSGPGSLRAPILLSLIAGLFIGVLMQRSRMCMAGGIRDVILIKDFTLVSGFVAILVFAFLGNLVTGNFHAGFAGQPVAHSAHLWNFLGMFAVGLGSALVGGCPMRQLILASEGSADSALSVLGMIAGAAFAHNFSLAGSADSAGVVGGPGTNGKIALIAGIIILLIIGAARTWGVKNENT